MALSELPAAAYTSSASTSGLKCGGCKTPASITNVDKPADRTKSRTKATSTPLVSSVPMSKMDMTASLIWHESLMGLGYNIAVISSRNWDELVQPADVDFNSSGLVQASAIRLSYLRAIA